MPISKEKMIATIEKSSSINEAARELGMTKQNIWERLKRYNLKVIKSMKVVKRSDNE